MRLFRQLALLGNSQCTTVRFCCCLLQMHLHVAWQGPVAVWCQGQGLRLKCQGQRFCFFVWHRNPINMCVAQGSSSCTEQIVCLTASQGSLREPNAYHVCLDFNPLACKPVCPTYQHLCGSTNPLSCDVLHGQWVRSTQPVLAGPLLVVTSPVGQGGSSILPYTRLGF